MLVDADRTRLTVIESYDVGLAGFVLVLTMELFVSRLWSYRMLV